MNDVRTAGPARANLSAGRLTAYGFSVEANIGHNPMRYLLARRFTAGPGKGDAVTALFVLRPDVLLGTYVWIVEDPAAGSCSVRTYLPTMKEPILVMERLHFDCLPLTEVGYLDLMAWPHPSLNRVGHETDPCLSVAHEVAKPDRAARLRRYRGPASVPGLHVTDVIAEEHEMVVARVIHRDARQVRRWEIVELGAAFQDKLPRRIRVSRPETGHRTDFLRTSDAIPIPEAAFEGSPEELCEAIVRRLRRESVDLG